MPEYSAQLKPLRLWNRLGVISLRALLPFTALVALALHHAIFARFAIPVVFGLFVALYSYAYFRIRTFRCPRCSNYVTVRYWWSPNTFGRKCVHCGLRLYDPA